MAETRDAGDDLDGFARRVRERARHVQSRRPAAGSRSAGSSAAVMMSAFGAPRDPSATNRVLSAGSPSASSIATLSVPAAGARHGIDASIVAPGGAA